MFYLKELLCIVIHHYYIILQKRRESDYSYLLSRQKNYASVTVAVAVLLESYVDVAVTVIRVPVVASLGIVSNPLGDISPSVADQTTVLGANPFVLTFALNCTVIPGLDVTAEGLIRICAMLVLNDPYATA